MQQKQQQQQRDAHCKQCPIGERPCMPPYYPPNPDIMFIGGFPLKIDVSRGAFTGPSSGILRSIITKMQRERPSKQQVRVDYTYACLCSPEFDEATKKPKITAEIVAHCSLKLAQRIDRLKPKVLVALGADALRGLGFKSKPSDMRGGIYAFKRADGVAIPVVATFNIVAVSKSPGLVVTFQKDLGKAFALAKDGFVDVEMDIHTPTTADDICAALDEILVAARANKAEDGKKLAVAWDTETTSLNPHVQEDRVIAVSMSHKSGFGMAYPWQHNACPFSDEDYARVRDKTAEVLSCPDIALLTANGKFDVQWLRYHYGLPVGPNVYDIVLAEHNLDEDKKGEYSLKDITRDRFPSMGKYEEELKEHLQAKWNAKAEEIARLTEEWKQSVRDAMLLWWMELSESDRLHWLGKWVESRYLELSDTADMHKVSYRKLKGEMVVPKKYQAAVAKLISRVPAETLPAEVVLPELVIPEELKISTYEDADLGILLRYAAIDALTTRMICEDQQQDFARENQRIANTEKSIGKKIPTRSCFAVMNDNTMPLSECLAHMEYYGVRLDRERAKHYKEVIEEKIAEAEEVMFTEVGWKFNTSASSPDLANILFSQMKLPVNKYTDTGAPSTDAEVIKELSDNYKLPFLEKLLVFRKLDKCLHTYIENWLKMSEYDGRIHAKFLQHGTATYRLSSAAPNLQNVPYSLREANLNLKALFIPDDGYDMYDLDISNAEMRVLTAYSRDEALIGAFNNGQDLHCLTAAGISEYSYEDIKAHKEDKTTDQYVKRQLAKKVNFGTIYCMSAERLQQQLWSELRIEESLEKCQEYLDKFFQTYPGVKAYIDGTKRFVEAYGYTWTFTGRRRRFALGAFSRGALSRMGRQAVNARIQTTSSDLVMYNLIDLHNWLLTQGGRVILTVHDSLPFQAPKGLTGVKAKLDELIMENTARRAPWLPVQWKYDVGRGPNYGDTHEEVE